MAKLTQDEKLERTRALLSAPPRYEYIKTGLAAIDVNLSGSGRCGESHVGAEKSERVRSGKLESPLAVREHRDMEKSQPEMVGISPYRETVEAPIQRPKVQPRPDEIGYT